MTVQLQAPPEMDIEYWFCRYDRRPTILPSWPASEKLSVVCLFENSGEPDQTQGLLMESESD